MIFILYLVYIIVGEANYSLVHKEKMDPKIIEQKEYLNAHAGDEHHEGAATHEAEGEHKATEEHKEGEHH